MNPNRWASESSPLLWTIRGNSSYPATLNGFVDVYPRAASVSNWNRDSLTQVYPPNDFQTPFDQYEPIPDGILGAETRILMY